VISILETQQQIGYVHKLCQKLCVCRLHDEAESISFA